MFEVMKIMENKSKSQLNEARDGGRGRGRQTKVIVMIMCAVYCIVGLSARVSDQALGYSSSSSTSSSVNCIRATATKST